MATRRLPVIQEPVGEDAEAAARPAWQWILIGSGLLVTICMPSVAVALAIAQKLAASRLGGAAIGASLAVGLLASTFALSSVAAGYLVARFGPRTLLRHALLAGLLAAAEIWVLALVGGAFTSGADAIRALLSLLLLSAPFCALGGWLRRRKKRPV